MGSTKYTAIGFAVEVQGLRSLKVLDSSKAT